MSEYRGRVAFMKFELMKPYFVLTSESLQQQYNVTVFPTLVLIANGQTVRRWEMVYDLNEYRRGIDAVLRQQAGSPPRLTRSILETVP